MKYRACLMLLLIALFSGSCKPDKGMDLIPDPKPTAPKVQLPIIFSGTIYGGSNGNITYDEHNLITSFKLPRGGDWKLIYTNGLIHHVLGPYTTFNGEFQRTSYIFQYNANKQLSKVLTKYIASYNGPDINDDNPFWSNETDGQSKVKDSLVYYGTQLKEIWSEVVAGSNQFTVIVFNYPDPNESNPTEVLDYSGAGRSLVQLELKYRTTLTYTNIAQPLSKVLWFVPYVYYGFIPVTPVPTAATSYPYLLLMTKCISKFTCIDYSSQPNYVVNSKNFVYQYNTDSTSFTGRYDPDDIIYDRFWYNLVIK